MIEYTKSLPIFRLTIASYDGRFSAGAKCTESKEIDDNDKHGCLVMLLLCTRTHEEIAAMLHGAGAAGRHACPINVSEKTMVLYAHRAAMVFFIVRRYGIDKKEIVWQLCACARC